MKIFFTMRLIESAPGRCILYYLYSFKKGKFFLQGSAIAPNADPSKVFCRASHAVVIRRVIISQHAKVKNFSRTSAALKKTFCNTSPPPHDNKTTLN